MTIHKRKIRQEQSLQYYKCCVLSANKICSYGISCLTFRLPSNSHDARALFILTHHRWYNLSGKMKLKTTNSHPGTQPYLRIRRHVNSTLRLIINHVSPAEIPFIFRFHRGENSSLFINFSLITFLDI